MRLIHILQQAFVMSVRHYSNGKTKQMNYTVLLLEVKFTVTLLEQNIVIGL